MSKIKQVQHTYLFKQLNGNDRIINNIKEIKSKGIIIKKENLQTQFLQIEKLIKNPTKQRVLDMVESRDIIMIYSPDGVKMPTAMPWFISSNSAGKVYALVCVDMFGRRDPDSGDVNIDYRKLYALLSMAYMGLKIYHNEKVVASRPSVLSNGSDIYSKMILKCLNKKYSLNLDKDKENKIRFLASKFYMINLLGIEDSDTVTNYAKKNCKNPNNYMLDILDNDFGPENYTDFGTFMQGLINHPSLVGILPNLTVRQFLEQFILMYDSSTVFSLESFYYFIGNLTSVTLGAFMNNQYILEDIMDKSGPKIFNDLGLI